MPRTLALPLPVRPCRSFPEGFRISRPNPFYSSANMCMLVNKPTSLPLLYVCVCISGCVDLSLCAFNDKIIRKVFVYFVVGSWSLSTSATLAWLSSHSFLHCPPPVNVTANLLLQPACFRASISCLHLLVCRSECGYLLLAIYI